MAAFDFPNTPSTNQTHTENGVQWKWNGTVWKRVESVAQKGQKGEVGDPSDIKGDKGEPSDVKGQKGEPSTTKGQKGEVGTTTKGQKGEPGSGSSNASTATIRTDAVTGTHPILFVDSSTDNQNQVLKMDDNDRLTWNPYSELLVAQNVASNKFYTWNPVGEGAVGQVITSGGSSAGWSWETPKPRVAQDVRTSNLANFTDNAWGNALQCQFNAKDAGTNILVRANINFTYGILNDTDDAGSMHVYFKIMKNVGSGWTQVGESLDMVDLYDESGNNASTLKINSHGGLEYADTGSTSYSGTIYYSLYAKYDEFGDDVSNSSFSILKGSSLTAMEYY